MATIRPNFDNTMNDKTLRKPDHQYDKIIIDLINEHKIRPIDIMGLGKKEAEGNLNYLATHSKSYIRTVSDVDRILQNEKGTPTILEIGPFLGVVSVALKKLGYTVHILDIPEFLESSSLRDLYERNGIKYSMENLRHYKLPYETNSFDMVVICETIEHMNFNPLPVLKEINRVLKKDGYIYVGMPNQSHILKRLKLLAGMSVHDPINDFFRQLDRNDNMIVGLHWREYTLDETKELIEKMGFNVVRSYYFHESKNISSLKGVVRSAVYSVPSLRPFHVVIGRKAWEPSYDFWLTEANS